MAIMTPEEQLDLWVAGKSVHNPDRNECCPDFSCCNPSLLAPPEMRQMFRDHPERREAMLFGFLGAALADQPVRLVGRPDTDWKP